MTKIIIGKETHTFFKGLYDFGGNFALRCKPFKYKGEKVSGLWLGGENLQGASVDENSLLGADNGKILIIEADEKDIDLVTLTANYFPALILRGKRFLSVENPLIRKINIDFSFKPKSIGGNDEEFIVNIEKKNLVADALGPECSQIKIKNTPASRKIFKDWEKDKTKEINIKINDAECYNNYDGDRIGMEIKVFGQKIEKETTKKPKEPNPFSEDFEEDLTFTIDRLENDILRGEILILKEEGVTIKGVKFNKISIDSGHGLLIPGKKVTIKKVKFGLKRARYYESEWYGRDTSILEIRGFFNAVREAKNENGNTTPPTNQTNNTQNQKPNNEEVKQEAQEEVAQENENAKNDLNDSINQAKNGDSEKKTDAIKNSGKSFGNKEFQQQQTEIKTIEDELFQEDPKKYQQAMAGKVEANLAANNLTESELNITDQSLNDQWQKVKNGEIKDRNQIEEITNQVNIKIIQKGIEKQINEYENQIKLVLQSNDEEKFKNLYLEVLKFTERVKNNIYFEGELESRFQNLIKKFENGFQTPTNTENPDNFPWVSLSISLAAVVGLLAVIILLVKSKKTKKPALKREEE